VKNHNTVVLANQGVTCWADTVTHAGCYVEVLDTYCWTLMLANQIGEPISFISPKKTSDLLTLKKRLGLPDARHDAGPTGSMRECQLCDMPRIRAEFHLLREPVRPPPNHRARTIWNPWSKSCWHKRAGNPAI
jgi:hypothetical protein